MPPSKEPIYATSLIMFALITVQKTKSISYLCNFYANFYANFLSHVSKALFFFKIALKFSHFLQKNAKFSSAGGSASRPRASGGWGLCPQTPSLLLLGASPPDPHWPPAAGVSAPRPPKTAPPLRISGYAPDIRQLQTMLF